MAIGRRDEAGMEAVNDCEWFGDRWRRRERCEVETEQADRRAPLG